MSDLMQRSAAFLASARKTSLSRKVSYRRGELELWNVLSTRGRSQYEVTDANGTLLRVECRDELIAPEMLADFGRPQRGDLIVDGNFTLEVCPPAPGIPEWEWCSPFRTMYRIHTKAVRSEPGTGL